MDVKTIWPGPAGALVGLAGASVVGLAAIVTALVYRGRDGRPYSPLNHWVSELGELGVSDLAAVFNLGLAVAGICFIFFMVALGWTRRTNLALLYVPVGAATGVAGFFGGVFPLNQLDQHSNAALGFFGLGWIAVGLASLDIYRRPERRFPRRLAAVGALTVLAFVGFLVVLAPLLNGTGFAPLTVRPDAWIVSSLEWAALIGIVLWVFFTAASWWRAERAGQPG